MNSIVTIELKELRFFAHHGVYAGEAKTGTEFEVSVILEWGATAEPIAHLHQTVNYVAAYNIVKRVFSIRQPLLETCATHITDELYAAFPVLEKVCVSIKKLHPPLTNFVGSLGVTYTRLFK